METQVLDRVEERLTYLSKWIADIQRRGDPRCESEHLEGVELGLNHALTIISECRSYAEQSE